MVHSAKIKGSVEEGNRRWSWAKTLAEPPR